MSALDKIYIYIYNPLLPLKIFHNYLQDNLSYLFWGVGSSDPYACPVMTYLGKDILMVLHIGQQNDETSLLQCSLRVTECSLD